MAPTHRRSAFTLTEMLVVIGIIIVLVSVLIPAVMKARRSSRQLACSANLHQLGQLIVMYADRNNDLLPMGITAVAPSPGIDPAAADDKWLKSPMWSCYLYAGGIPSCNVGPIYASGLLTAGSAKILYCPNDADERLTWNLWRNKFPAPNVEPPTDLTIRISYFARPIGGLYKHTRASKPAIQLVYPSVLLPRLDDLRGKALYAERNSHGTDANPRANVLYQDGSVRLATLPRAPDSALAEITPDDLPPRTQTDTTSGPDGPPRITVFSWNLLDSQ